LNAATEATSEVSSAEQSAPAKDLVLSPSDQSIRELVNDLHNAWENSFKSRNSDELLALFLDEYSINQVRIDTAGIPMVRASNFKNFPEYVQAFLDIEGLALDFGQVDMLYTEVKDDFFVASYKCKYRAYMNNELTQTTSLITTITGRNEGGWKIGNYSWVTVAYGE